MKIGYFKSVEKIDCVMPIKLYRKKNSFYMSSNNLLVKYDLQDNHWVEYSEMEPVGSVVFQ